MANFDEKSGIIPCNTPWGKWLQTVEDVFVEVLVPEGTKCKEISINIQTRTIKVVVSGKEVFSVIIFMLEQSEYINILIELNFFINTFSV